MDMFSFVAGMFFGVVAWPWLGLTAFIVLCLIDSVLVEYENAAWGTGLMIVGTGFLMWLVGDVNPFMAVWYNLKEIAVFVMAYGLIGILWSFIRWGIYVRKEAKKARAEGAKSRPTHTYASYNKARIISWIGHWPFSVIGTFFGEFLKGVLVWIYNQLSGVYEKMGNRAFAGMPEEDTRGY